jgi:hypothetical protein
MEGKNVNGKTMNHLLKKNLLRCQIDLDIIKFKLDLNLVSYQMTYLLGSCKVSHITPFNFMFEYSSCNFVNFVQWEEYDQACSL